MAMGIGALAVGALVVWFFTAPPSGPKIVTRETPAAEAPAKAAAPERSAALADAQPNPDHVRPGHNPNLEAEDTRLKAVNTDNFKTLEWKVLRGLNVKTGELTPQVKAFEGGSVKIPGFMVPFDDDEEKVTQFLLVPVAGMCIHMPPPPPNQMIMVEMSSEAKMVDWNRQITVYGQLEISQSQSPYGAVSYKLNATVARAE